MGQCIGHWNIQMKKKTLKSTRMANYIHSCIWLLLYFCTIRMHNSRPETDFTFTHCTSHTMQNCIQQRTCGKNFVTTAFAIPNNTNERVHFSVSESEFLYLWHHSNSVCHGARCYTLSSQVLQFRRSNIFKWKQNEREKNLHFFYFCISLVLRSFFHSSFGITMKAIHSLSHRHSTSVTVAAAGSSTSLQLLWLCMQVSQSFDNL